GCEQCEWGEQQRSHIEGGNSPELRLHDPHRQHGRNETDQNPAAHQPKTSLQYEAEYVPALCAESHADAEVVRLKRNRVGHDTEETDEGETKSDAGAGAERDQAELGFHVDVLLEEFVNRT